MQNLRNAPWFYMILMQNDDILIKSNREIVAILQLLDGADDMQMLV